MEKENNLRCWEVVKEFTFNLREIKGERQGISFEVPIGTKYYELTPNSNFAVSECLLSLGYHALCKSEIEELVFSGHLSNYIINKKLEELKYDENRKF